MSEYAVKSALFFKLPRFVYQPGEPGQKAIRMCVLGRNPFDSALEKLAQLPIDERPVQLHKPVSVAEAAGCDFLFIARSEADGVEGILRRLGGHPVVTVSDIEGFARAGGMVEFALGRDAPSIAILINRKAARARNVEFNAQLLRLSTVVEP